MITRLNDRIECLVHFKNSHLIPLRFLWNGRSYKINSITSQYQTKDAGVIHLNFAVLSGPNLYQLIYTPADHTWKLGQVSLAD